MTSTDAGEEASLFPKTAGERLRDARNAQGLSLTEIAARTRVPLRHLEAIESSDYGSFPSPAYAVGFAKAYARAVGVDEVGVGSEVRSLIDNSGRRPPEYVPYEMTDPTRLPSRGLALLAAAVAVFAIAAAWIWFGTNWFRPAPQTEAAGVSAPVSAPAPAPAITTAAPTPTPAAGQVSLTATDVVWLRVYDAANNTLKLGELQPGERYDVPAGADHPMINVGRPDKLTITVNGSTVPALGSGKRAIKDVAIDAASLLARGTATNGADGTLRSIDSAPPSARASQLGDDRARDRPARRDRSASSADEVRDANAASANATQVPSAPAPPGTTP